MSNIRDKSEPLKLIWSFQSFGNAKKRGIVETSLSRYEKLSKSDDIKLPESSENSLFSNNRLHNSTSARRLRKELQKFTTNPTPGITAHLKEENLYEWEATIEGPDDSPYEGGTFLLNMIFSEQYPMEPPKVTFRTKVYHCNINSEGWISLDILNNQWAAAMSVSTALLSIQSLLTDCNPEDALVPEIAAQYVNDRQEYDRICREWTKKYATEEFGM